MRWIPILLRGFTRSVCAALACMLALSMPALAEAAAARRVVSMSPSLTEILIAVGARATLVGVDSYSKKVSPEVADLPTIGGLFNPSLEAVVALEPDLVALVPSAQQRDFTNRLEALGIEVLGLPNITLADVLSSIVALGERVGRGTAARAVVARIRENWRAIGEATSSFEAHSAVLVIQREPLYVVGAGSFIDAMLTASGLKNAAGIFEEPYPRVAVEWLIEAAPEVILDATETAVEPAAYWSRWPSLPAVGAGRTYAVSASDVTLPGPELDRALRIIAELVHGVGGDGGPGTNGGAAP